MIESETRGKGTTGGGGRNRGHSTNNYRRRRGRRGKRHFMQTRIARQRVAYLNALADEMAVGGRLDLAGRYLTLARKVGMKYNVRQPKGFRMKYCRECRVYLMSGKSAVIRLKKGVLQVRCGRCGRVRRKPYRWSGIY